MELRRDELAPNQCPHRGKPLYIVGGGVDNAGGETGEVMKEDGSDSSPIAVTFRDMEAKVPIIGLELFEGVVVVTPKHLEDLSEGFDVSVLVAV